MKRFVVIALFALFVISAMPAQGIVHADSGPLVKVTSHYTLTRYGFASVNETVSFTNNSTSPIVVPDVKIGFGGVYPLIAGTPLVTNGYSVAPTGQEFTVSSGSKSLPAGGKDSFTLSVLLYDATTKASNGSLVVSVLASPSVSLKADRALLVMTLPPGILFSHAPAGFNAPEEAQANDTYSRTYITPVTLNASTFQGVVGITPGTASDFHPIDVKSATRKISIAGDGSPLVTDSFTFINMGQTSIQSLTLTPLLASGGKITVLPPLEPRLLGPYAATLEGFQLGITNPRIGAPINAGTGFTIAYSYPLQSKYYTASGGTIVVTIPNTPPLPAFVDSYSIVVALPNGVALTQGSGSTIEDAGPRQTGSTAFGYSVSVGWAVDDGIPAASLLFVLVFAGLFVSRSTMTVEEETEEESSTERASAMIKAFEEKTSMINGLWSEISGADPNDLSKAYFDEKRSRLDSFRSRALQRLNELKQKSTTQKFFDLLSQIHTTEREVERAAKDTLNLYEQYYTRRMRKEVYDRLQPQYIKRLEKAMNQLADELLAVQREAKLL